MKRKIKNSIGLLIIISVLITMFVPSWAQPAAETKKSAPAKKVLMVIAPKDYEDVELFTPKAILETNGAKVSVASTEASAVGAQGRVIKTDLLISQAKVSDYDAIVVVGGTGVIGTLWDNPELRTLLQEADKQKKIIGAICAAPPTLSKAGLLKDKKATMFPWDDGIKELTAHGAIYVNEETVVSDNIVTGKNPDASKAFGLELCDVLGIRKFEKKVLMIIAQKDFEDVELFDPKTILEVNGAKITVASTTTDTATGSNGSRVTPDIKISAAKASDFDAIVVVGGTGVIGSLWEDTSLRKLLQDANKNNKVIAAICAAPPVLSKAGLLKNKKATMFPWDDGIKELTKYGAKYVNEEVVVSGNIVTGRNPDASQAFGLKLCEVLKILHA